MLLVLVEIRLVIDAKLDEFFDLLNDLDLDGRQIKKEPISILCIVYALSVQYFENLFVLCGSEGSDLVSEYLFAAIYGLIDLILLLILLNVSVSDHVYVKKDLTLYVIVIHVVQAVIIVVVDFIIDRIHVILIFFFLFHLFISLFFFVPLFLLFLFFFFFSIDR